MNLEKLTKVIRASWSKETCHIPLRNKWTKEQPEIGQCAATVLVIQDFLGGEIIHDKKNKHYWNQLNNRDMIDFTRSQFPEDTEFHADEILTRENLFQPHAQTRERYIILKKEIAKKIKNHI